MKIKVINEYMKQLKALSPFLVKRPLAQHLGLNETKLWRVLTHDNYRIDVEVLQAFEDKGLLSKPVIFCDENRRIPLDSKEEYAILLALKVIEKMGNDNLLFQVVGQNNYLSEKEYNDLAEFHSQGYYSDLETHVEKCTR